MYFITSYHIHTAIYNIYLVEGGVPNVVVHVHRIGIAAYLGLGLLHGSFDFRICSIALQILQLDDI